MRPWSQKIEAVSYYSYLLYKNIPYADRVASDLITILYDFIITKKDEEAAVLYGFMEAAGKNSAEYISELHKTDELLIRLEMRMPKDSYNACIKRGKELYDKEKIYENARFEARYKKSIFESYRLTR